MLFLKDDKNKEDNDDEDIKNNFNELIDLNKKLSEVYENNVKNDLLEIIDQLNYCILEVEGINRAFERFNAFIKDYEKAKADNKYVSEEKSKIEHDKEDFEESILKDLKKYDRENEFIYEQIIEKLIFYIKKVSFSSIDINNNLPEIYNSINNSYKSIKSTKYICTNSNQNYVYKKNNKSEQDKSLILTIDTIDFSV